MAVGSKLAQIINDKGLTQKEVAEKAGIKPQTLNKIIVRDSARADIQIFIKICKALDVDISVFSEDAIEEFYQDHPNALRIEKPKMTSRQKHIVDLFDKLTEPQQDNIIGRAEMLAEQNLENTTVKVYRAAESDNGYEDEILEVPREYIRRIEEAPETDDDF